MINHISGQTRPTGMEDYLMFSTAPQTPLQKIPSQSLDTEETLRLAMQKLKQTPQPSHQQQQQTANIPHAYVIPIPVMPSENMQNIVQHPSNYTSAMNANETLETIGSTNGPTTLNPTRYQFAPIIPDGPNITGPTSDSLVAPTPISGSVTNSGYLHYHQGPTLANFQTFGYTPHGGFFLPAGYRLIYAPTSSPHSQPATPATPHLGNSNNGTPPGEPQHCSEYGTTVQPDQ